MRTGKDILKGLRNLIQNTHWAQGTMHRWDETNGKSYYCAVGGMRHVAGFSAKGARGSYNDPAYNEALLDLVVVLAKEGDWRSKDLVMKGVILAVRRRERSLTATDVANLEAAVISYNDSHQKELVLNAVEQAISAAA